MQTVLGGTHLARFFRHETSKEGGRSFGKIKNPDGAGIFLPVFSLNRHPIGRVGDAGITGTLANP